MTATSPFYVSVFLFFLLLLLHFISFGKTTTTMVNFATAFRQKDYNGGNYAKGSVSDALTKSKKKISALISTHDEFWIGITSGGVAGCRARWNDKYKDDGMDCMAIIYVTNRVGQVAKMEKQLIKNYRDHCRASDLQNITSGGEGACKTASKPYVVYLVWKKTNSFCTLL
jgi:hypothetical protein